MGSVTGDSDANLILEAIDKGGGQTCNAEGVVRALREAGFVIVRVEGVRENGQIQAETEAAP